MQDARNNPDNYPLDNDARSFSNEQLSTIDKMKSESIEWERGELIENHGSGCKYYALTGVDGSGKKWQATGVYQGDDLEDVEDIEEL